VDGIAESEFPALFRAADLSAIRGQRRLLTATAFRLSALLAAAVLGGLDLITGRVDVAALGAAGTLGVALVTEVFLLTTRPDKQWYEARAAAESAKTLAWRFIVGGQPFGIMDRDEQEAEQLLLYRFGRIVGDLHRYAPLPCLDGRAQVTESMRVARALSLEERKGLYLRGRIEDQRAWYTRRAIQHDRSAIRWSVGLAGLEALGLVAAVLNAAQVFTIDLPGIVGAAAAAGVAWLQTRQHQQLASAYAIAAQELADIASRADWASAEEEWAHFIDEAEEAISREHTMWWASHA
jgi:hypothetical protein